MATKLHWTRNAVNIRYGECFVVVFQQVRNIGDRLQRMERGILFEGGAEKQYLPVCIEQLRVGRTGTARG